MPDDTELARKHSENEISRSRVRQLVTYSVIWGYLLLAGGRHRVAHVGRALRGCDWRIGGGRGPCGLDHRFLVRIEAPFRGA